MIDRRPAPGDDSNLMIDQLTRNGGTTPEPMLYETTVMSDLERCTLCEISSAIHDLEGRVLGRVCMSFPEGTTPEIRARYFETMVQIERAEKTPLDMTNL